MASTESMDLAQQLYVGYYGRPADPDGQDYWAERFDESTDLTDALNQFGTSEEYTQSFGSLTTEELIENLYQQLFGRSADSAGLAFYADRITSGEATLVSIAKQVLDGASGDDAIVLSNKISVANTYTLAVESNNAEYTADDIEAAQGLLSSVDATDESVDSANSMIDDIIVPGDDPSPPETTADLTYIDTISYDGVVETITTTKINYNEDGLEVKSVSETDNGADDTVDSAFTITSTYDSNGNAIKLVTENDDDADGTIDSIITATFTFSGTGCVTMSVTETDSNADGTVDERATVNYTYDANNNLLTLIKETDLEADGSIDSRVTHTYTYDSNNNMTSLIEDDDTDADGNIDERITTNYSYDESGNMTLKVKETDTGADGTNDGVSTTSYTYDENGNNIHSTLNRDSDADGNIDYSSETTTTYDSNNNAVEEINDETIMTYINGTLFTTTTYQITTTYTYDADNNLVTQVIETDINGDGIADMRSIQTQNWDEVITQTSSEGTEYMTGTLYSDLNTESSISDILSFDTLNSSDDNDIELMAVQEAVSIDGLIA